MAKPYRIDDKPASASEVIRAAEALGYHRDDGLRLTSEAAQVLRQHGHEVTTNQAYAGDS